LSNEEHAELALRNQYNSTDAPQHHSSKNNMLRKSVGLNKTLYTSIMNGSFGPSSAAQDATSNLFIKPPIEAV